jgi:hypothetical protein
MSEEKTQSGKQVAWGIIAFIVGLIAILVIVKLVFGM